MENLRTIEGGRQLYQFTMMFYQVGVVRDLHWESKFSQNMEIREATMDIY